MVLTSGFRLNAGIRSEKDLLSAIKDSLGETYQGDPKSLEKLAENLWRGNQSDHFVSKEEFLAATQKIEEGKHLLNMFQGLAPIADPQGVWQQIMNAKASPIKASDGFLASNGGFYGGFGDEAVVTEIDKNNKEALKRSGLNDTQIGFIQENPNLAILEVIKDGETTIYATEFNKKETSSTICKVGEVSGKAASYSRNYVDPNSPFADLNSPKEARPEYHAKKFNFDGNLILAASPENLSSNFVFDGELDRVNQQTDGNCVVLASIVASINDAELKDKLETQISKDPATGDYIVYLPGAKQKDTTGEGGMYSDNNGGVYARVTADDLEKNKTLAGIDGDVLILATAVEKYFNQYGKKDDREIYNPETKSIEIRKFNTTTNGLLPTDHDVASLFTGHKGTLMDVRSQEWRELITKKSNNLNVTANFDLPDDLSVKMGDDNAQVLIERHRYAVTSYDPNRGTYTIANPWNSEKKFEINAEYFDYYARDVINHA
jgi:hypothetical protein